MGRPVFFIQERTGKFGKPFKIFKLRTMSEKKDKSGNLLPDEERLTYLGKFLRTSSLDELPELVNVLKGEMSIVGPRPLLLEYLPYYSEFQRRRMEVKPGITGLAQVSGRNSISWEDKFKLDIYYIDNFSIILDLKILILTIFRVISQNGITTKENKAMPKFSETQKLKQSKE